MITPSVVYSAFVGIGLNLDNLAVLLNKGGELDSFYFIDFNNNIKQSSIDVLQHELLEAEKESGDETLTVLSVEKIHVWSKLPNGYSIAVNMDLNKIVSSLDAIPDREQAVISQCYWEFDEKSNYTIVKLDFKFRQSLILIDILEHESWLNNIKDVSLLYSLKKRELFKRISLKKNNILLDDISRQKTKVIELIDKRLSELKGKLTGIRGQYIEN